MNQSPGLPMRGDTPPKRGFIRCWTPVFLSFSNGSFVFKPEIRHAASSTLKEWEQFDPQTLKKCLTFFCTQAWPQCKSSDGETWPPQRSTNYNTIPQLDLFCHKECNWSEVQYVQAFFALRDRPNTSRFCGLTPASGTLTNSSPSAVSCSPHTRPTEKSQSTNLKPLAVARPKRQAPGPLLPKSPPSSLLPLQQVANGGWGPVRVHIPFSLQDLGR